MAGKLPDAPVSDDEDTEEAVDPALAAARDALDSGDFEAARTAYQGLLDGGATGAVAAEATASVRQITFLIRATGQPQDAVLAANAAPGDIDAGLAAADVEVLSQQPDSAFDRLVALVRGTSDDDRAKVRARLLELFELFDPADPAVIAGRRKLANALF